MNDIPKALGKSFKNVDVISYQDTAGKLKEKKAVTICLNSLERLSDLDEEEIANYILYIDEVNSFWDFTQNTTLWANMKHIYYILRIL